MAVISELETVHRTTNRWVKSQAVSPHRAVGYQTTERLTVASLQPLQIFKNRIVNIDCGAHDQYHTAINDPFQPSRRPDYPGAAEGGTEGFKGAYPGDKPLNRHNSMGAHLF